jgi:membrane protein
VPRLAAALAFYTVFSLAPLLVIIISIAGLVFGELAVKGLIVDELSGYLGAGAGLVQDMIAGASEPSSSIVATLIGVGILLFGASRVFVHLQEALDTVWEVDPENKGIINTIKNRFVAFLMILSAGFFILLSLAFSAVLKTISVYFADWYVSGVCPVIDFVVRFGVITLLFALIFKTLPQVKVAWGDVWLGALVTTLLFGLGRYLLGLYLSRGRLSSVYGAAGSLAILLYWCYYSAQIFFIGAEITQTYARQYGSHLTRMAHKSGPLSNSP